MCLIIARKVNRFVSIGTLYGRLTLITNIKIEKKIGLSFQTVYCNCAPLSSKILASIEGVTPNYPDSSLVAFIQEM